MAPRERRRPAWRALLCAGLAQTCLACASTTYGSYDESHDASSALPPHLERRVTFQVTRALFQAPPDCVLVLPLRGASDLALAGAVEGALSRYLGQRVRRVVGPLERNRGTRRLALDTFERRRPAPFGPRPQLRCGS